MTFAGFSGCRGRLTRVDVSRRQALSAAVCGRAPARISPSSARVLGGKLGARHRWQEGGT
jgi:hypothetical protein